MTIELALARGRAMAEARMLDACRITRPGDGEDDFDETTGQHVTPEPVVVYEGPCRIPPRDSSAAAARAGEAAWEVGEYPLHLPIEHAGYAEAVQVNQTVTYLTAAHDPELVGNVYGITAIADASQATARRLRMKRTTGN